MKLLIVALVAAALAVSAIAQDVKTVDGQNLSGEVRLADGKLLIKGSATTTSIDLSSIDHATFTPATQPLHGLKAEYFSDTELKSHRMSRIDPTVYLNTSNGMGDPALGNGFSVRWTGQLTAPYADNVTIILYHNGGIRFWVNDKLLIDHWINDVGEIGVAVKLDAGQVASVRIEYFAPTKTAAAWMRWYSNNFVCDVIDSLYLTPPPDYKPEADAVVPMKPGHGFYAQYFGAEHLEGMLFDRTDATIDFDWRVAPPDPRLRDSMSVRWAGYVTPSQTETYGFSMVFDGAARLFVDGKIVCDYWQYGRGEVPGVIALQAGKPVFVEMDYFNPVGTPTVQLYWSSPHVPREIIPLDAITPSNADELRTKAAATGLRVEYFSDPTFKKRLLARHDSTINFDANDGVSPLPDPLLQEAFGAVWTGQLTAPKDGHYTLTIFAQNRARLFLDGKLFLDGWTVGGEHSADIDLQAGKPHALRYEFANDAGAARVRLYWARADLVKEIIGPANLTPPATDPKQLPDISLDFPVRDFWLDTDVVPLKAVPWAAPGDHVKRVDFFCDSTLIGSCDHAPYTMQWTHPPAGRHIVRAWVVDDAELNISAYVPITVISSAATTLPAGWVDFHFGGPQTPADSTQVKDGAFSLGSAPGDLWSSHDAAHFVSRLMDGDGQYIVRLNSLTPAKPGASAVAGLMIRDVFLPGSRHLSLAIVADGRNRTPSLVHRDQSDSPSSLASVAGTTGSWLKLTRLGQHFEAFVSNDGVTWLPAGQIDLFMHSKVSVGLFCVGVTDSAANAVFDHVDFHQGPPALAYSTSGVLTRCGSFIAGPLRHSDTENVRVFHNGADLILKNSDASCLITYPVPAQFAAALGVPHTGVLLTSGDFAEGDFVSGIGYVLSMNSVLFGPQTYTSEALAAVLHPVKLLPGYQITTVDGSIYRVDAIKGEGSDLVFTDPLAGAMKVPSRDIVEIVKVK